MPRYRQVGLNRGYDGGVFENKGAQDGVGESYLEELYANDGEHELQEAGDEDYVPDSLYGYDDALYYVLQRAHWPPYNICFIVKINSCVRSLLFFLLSPPMYIFIYMYDIFVFVHLRYRASI